MKKLIIATFLLVLSASHSFANESTPVEKANKDITASFNRDFHRSEILKTEIREGFTKLTFKMNNQVMFAYYSGKGELLAVSRNILSTQLPISLMMSLKTTYKDRWISDLVEMSTNDHNSYYVTLENADNKLTLRSNGGDWEVYASDKK